MHMGDHRTISRCLVIALAASLCLASCVDVDVDVDPAPESEVESALAAPPPPAPADDRPSVIGKVGNTRRYLFWCLDNGMIDTFEISADATEAEVAEKCRSMCPADEAEVYCEYLGPVE